MIGVVYSTRSNINSTFPILGCCFHFENCLHLFVFTLFSVSKSNFPYHFPNADTFHYLYDILTYEYLLIAASNNATAIHYWSLINELALSLFVLRIFTDNSDRTFSFNNFALFTNWFYWWSNCHVKPSFHKKTVIQCNT